MSKITQNDRTINDVCLYCYGTLNKNRVCTRCYHRADDDRVSYIALPPRTLLNNRYIIAKFISKGGFGITYMAWDLLTSSKVAIKEFFPNGYTARTSRSYAVGVTQPVYQKVFAYWLQSFQEEALQLIRLQNIPDMLKIYDYFMANGTAYIVMEFIKGINLRELLDSRGGMLPVGEALNLLYPIALSLKALHQNGMIHRDISPENIMITTDKRVLLIDFASASLYSKNSIKPFSVRKKGFSPIEVLTNNMAHGPYTDVYSYAATMYQCICGSAPPDCLQRMQGHNITSPRYMGIPIPPNIEKALFHALEIYPQNRTQSIAQLGKELSMV